MRTDTQAPLTVLLVDDDEATRLLLADAVSGMAEIIEADCGETALQQARLYRPDLILLDISMPDLSGIEVCEILKADPEFEHPVVIFITATESEVIETQALGAGGVDYLTKPINVENCRLKVKNHLQQSAQVKQVKLEHQALTSMISSLPVQVTYWTRDWVNKYSNDPEGAWFGHSATEMSGRSIDDLLPPRLARLLRRFATQKTGSAPQISYLHNGSERHLQVNFVNANPVTGVQGYLLTLIDITSLKKTERELQLQNKNYNVTLNVIGDGVISINTDGRVTYMNPIAERLTGISPVAAYGLPIEEVFVLHDGLTGDRIDSPWLLALEHLCVNYLSSNSQLAGDDGHVYPIEGSAATVTDTDGTITGAVIVFRDLSDTVAISDKMDYLAYHDQLTGLPNRVLLQQRLEDAIAFAQASGLKTALILIDLDNFKYINDSLGHTQGNSLIKQVADRLSKLSETRSTLSRIGGDEFAMVIPYIDDISQVERMAINIHKQMEKPFKLTEGECGLSVSMGISIAADDAADAEDLMRLADVAMYRAKYEGRGRHCFFSNQLEEDLLSRHAIEQLIRTTIKHQSFEVHYQAKFSLWEYRIVGVEALVRMRDSNGRLISPCEFIPVAEELNLIEQLGEQVLETACSDADKWLPDHPEVPVAVNVSASQLKRTDFVDRVMTILGRSSLPPEMLELEVTESALMQNIETAQEIIEALHNQGIVIALDDFGTGYSSLTYLQRFNIDVLKIDQSFIQKMGNNTDSLAIVKNVISLGKSLNLRVCPEGIETQDQLNELIRLGCEMGQGYLFCRPIPIDEFIRFMEDVKNHSESAGNLYFI
ncbi:PAS domain S-box-containing protein/diguanylate cyclase (GGDEF) domain-containing protein [Amphritea atlantica]|uniref:PAS domain S-box-containing protein/diguanylate cyclase (GGDEF) domain-containing protein n=1 Tax=Amphritea atlantica TaxID=355243 RepID=A0A1H9DIT7_9GAMM|nr:EAL domain-containing protein [Amphritea atlantica]SEQ13410.1 PAS domain S-box-containing protein/diguanylate cyclase (GGDEF) domain-containing protein [Amphritea atlantica]